MLRILLIIIEVVTCILLIGVILLQKSRDSGLGMAFGAGMGESLFGAQAGNVLTRITIILAAVFLVNTTLLAVVQPVREESLVDRMLPAAPGTPEAPRQQPPPEETREREAVPLMPTDLPDDPEAAAPAPGEAPLMPVDQPDAPPQTLQDEHPDLDWDDQMPAD